jgi:hypothetical protein
MKNIHTFEEFLNESRLNEAKKEKFLLYTNPNNSTNRAYVAIGSAKVKDVMSSARKYSGSYDIIHQGNGTNDDLQKAISMFRQYNFGDVSMDEGFLGEKIVYLEGAKNTGDKILDKLAKLLNSSSSTIEITARQVRGKNVAFSFSQPSTFFVVSNDDHYFMNTNKGFYRVDKKDITKAEDLYDELESIIQAGKTKRPSSRETDAFGKSK